MSTDFVEEASLPFKPQECFLTYDWRFTEQAHYDFKQACYNKLREAQEKGKGYFIEVTELNLYQELLKSLEKADYASVANYAMMMATKERVEMERLAWLNKKTHSSLDELNPDEPF